MGPGPQSWYYVIFQSGTEVWNPFYLFRLHPKPSQPESLEGKIVVSTICDYV